LTNIKKQELQKLLDWALTEVFETDEFYLPNDWYWKPLDVNAFFDMSTPLVSEGVGSLEDEIDLLRKSIIEGDGYDCTDLVLERLAFIFVAMSASVANRRP
jgi:hypothetical protein